LPVGVAYAVLAFDSQGGIVLLGGATNTEQSQGTTAIYRYNISLNSWTLEQATAPQAFNGSASCSLGNGKVVVVGGYRPERQIALDNTWLIDLNTLQSTALPPLPQGGSRLGAAAYDGRGNVYVVRGVINNPDQPTSDFWKLNLNL
jgi:Galactose oxidase, central domain